MPKALFGRRVIYTDTDNITSENILEVLGKALKVHLLNVSEIEYLLKYYRGNQPILERTKEYNTEICNQIVENRANEIVAFKVGYLMGEPVQYVARKGEEAVDDINLLNDYVFSEDKASKDRELAEWWHVCGTSYRMCLPNPNADEDEAPFTIYTMDPRNTFVVYWSGLGHKPVMGVNYVKQENGDVIFTCYTKNGIYSCYASAPGVAGIMAPTQIRAEINHIYGDIPIVEYPANSSRLGAFEIVLPLLDMINNLASNRMDGVEQFIQAILCLKGTDLTDDEFEKVKEYGGLSLPADGDAKYLTSQLDQSQTQTLVSNEYNTVLTICGMPNRNGGTSTSDNGVAVIYRDGWQAAEARAKDSEGVFKLSEKKFLKILLEIMNTYRGTNLRVSQIDIRFTRRNYEDILSKSQVLTTMLANPKIHPILAFEHCGMFVDPERAYSISDEYYKAVKAEEAKRLKSFANSQHSEEDIVVEEAE